MNLVTIHLNEIPESGREYSFIIDESTINSRLSLNKEDRDDLHSFTPSYLFDKGISTNFRVTKNNKRLEILGTVCGKFSTPCARCAENTTQEINSSFNFVCKPFAEAIDGDNDDSSIVLYRDEEIDLTENIGESLIIALPYTALCSEHCKGLCSSCGARLNIETCQCKPKETTDERMSIFKSIKIQ